MLGIYMVAVTKELQWYFMFCLCFFHSYLGFKSEIYKWKLIEVPYQRLFKAAVMFGSRI